MYVIIWVRERERQRVGGGGRQRESVLWERVLSQVDSKCKLSQNYIQWTSIILISVVSPFLKHGRGLPFRRHRWQLGTLFHGLRELRTQTTPGDRPCPGPSLGLLIFYSLSPTLLVHKCMCVCEWVSVCVEGVCVWVCVGGVYVCDSHLK
jgi:hypothetical protein